MRRKRYLAQGVGALCLLCLTLFAAAYGEGIFDLAFAHRTPTLAPSETVTPPPAWQLPEVGESAPVAVTPAAALSSFSSLYDAIAAGQVRTTERLGAYVRYTLGMPDIGGALPFSERMTFRETEVRVPVGKDAAYRSELSMLAVPQPVYTLYMGYILCEHAGSRTLYDGMGACLITDFTFTPAYARTPAGEPLFAADGGGFAYYDQTTRTMCAAECTEVNRPLAAGLDFAVRDPSPYVRFTENGKWGYKYRESGEVAIAASYAAAYDFVRNPDPAEDRPEYAWLAVVFSADKGHLQIIDGTGGLVADTYRGITYDLQAGSDAASFEAWEGCYLPEWKSGVATLGMDAIDANGVLCVRRRVVRKDNHSVVPVDTECLLQIVRDGENDLYRLTYLSLPAGYRLCAYTEGVCLLQDTVRGTYGYYSYTGYWLSTPEFTSAAPMREGVAAVMCKDGKMGLFGANGRYVLAPVFSYVSDPSDGVVLVYDTTLGWRLLCKMKGTV